MRHKQPNLPTTLCPQCHTTITLPPGPTSRRLPSIIAAALMAGTTFFLGYFWPGADESKPHGKEAKPAGMPLAESAANVTARAPVIRKISLDTDRDQTWKGLVAAFHAEEESQPPFAKGSVYQFTLRVTQVGEDFVLTNRFKNSGPFGILRHGTGALDDVPLEGNEFVKVVVRFTGYEHLTMVSGASERIASFNLLALYSFRGFVCSFE